MSEQPYNQIEAINNTLDLKFIKLAYTKQYRTTEKTMPVSKNINLFKKLEIIQETPEGMKISYTCYEAIPNGGFCVISAEPIPSKGTNTEGVSFVRLSEKETHNISSNFHATLIDAIRAFTPKIPAC